MPASDQSRAVPLGVESTPLTELRPAIYLRPHCGVAPYAGISIPEPLNKAHRLDRGLLLPLAEHRQVSATELSISELPSPECRPRRAGGLPIIEAADWEHPVAVAPAQAGERAPDHRGPDSRRPGAPDLRAPARNLTVLIYKKIPRELGTPHVSSRSSCRKLT